MKPRYTLPALAASLAVGGAFLTLQAQDAPQPKLERKFDFKFNGDPRLNGQMKEQLRKMMEQMDPSGEAREQFEKALEGWEGSGELKPGQPQQFRFEWRSDGAVPRLFRNGQEVKPEDKAAQKNDEAPADPRERMRREMEREMQDLLRKHMGEGFGQGNSPFDELFKQMRERGGPQRPQGNNEGGRGLEDLLRRMQGGDHGEPASASRYCKEHRSVLAEWRPQVKAARDATVRLMRDSKQVAFATVVTADGYALTKASEVNDDGLEAEFNNGRIVSAKVVDKLEAYDLALIKLEASGLTPARFSSSDVPVGTLVAAVGVDEDPLATGVVSIAARSLSEKGKGALGIRFDPSAAESDKGVTISAIIDNCPADRAGLEKGDVILSINGTEVNFPFQLIKVVSAMKPGDSVKVRYSRDGKESEAEFPLTSRDELNKIQEEEFKAEFRRENGGKEPPDLKSLRLDPTARMTGSVSANAGGYPNAVQSDLAIDAKDCGGPVVDVDGNIVALINARAERVSTYMIPGKVIESLLVNLQSGKFTLAKDADTLRGELRDYEEAIRKAREAMEAAEASRTEAEAALKKLGQ
jgi:serine protease Do